MVEVGNRLFSKEYTREYYRLLDDMTCTFGVFDVIRRNPGKRHELSEIAKLLNRGLITTLEATALGSAIVKN